MNLSFLFFLTALTIVAVAERDKFKATIKKLKCSLDIAHNCKTVILRSSAIKCNTKRNVRVANAVVKSAKGSSFTLSFVATRSKTSITKASVKCMVPIKTTPKPTPTPKPPTSPPQTTTIGPGRMKCRCMCQENFICDCDCPSKNSGSTDCPKGFKRVCPTLSDGTCGSREMMCDGGGNLENRDGSFSFVESIIGKVIQEDRMEQMESIDDEEHCTCIPDMVLHLIKPRANRTSTLLTEDTRRISGAIVIRNVLIQNPNIRCTFKLVCLGNAINTITSKAKCTPSQKKPLNKKVKLTSAAGDTFLVAISVKKTVTKITWGTCLPVSNPTTTTVPLSMSSSATVETITTSGKTSFVEQGNGTTQLFESGNDTTSGRGSEIETTTTSGSESESTSKRGSTTSSESESGSTLESLIHTGTPEEFSPEKRTTQEVVSQNELTDCVCVDVKSTETGSGSGSVNETESGCGSGSDGLSRQCQGNVTETGPLDPVEITWVFGMTAADICVTPGTQVIFAKSGHNVDELSSESDYDSCTGITNTVPDMGADAGDWTWTAPAGDVSYFFVCGVGSHCSSGNMRAKITVSSVC